MNVTDIIKAKAKQKISRVLLVYLFPWNIILVALVIALAALIQTLSSIAIVGAFAVSYDTNKNAQAVEMTELNDAMEDDILETFHVSKPNLYLDYESGTYPKNFNNQQLLYSTSVDVSDGFRQSGFYEYTEESEPSGYNSIVVPLETYTYPYRTFYQLFQIPDNMMKYSSSSDTSVIDSVFDNLATEFTYTFDCIEVFEDDKSLVVEECENFQYYESTYINTFIQTDEYLEGSIVSTTYDQENTLVRTPIPFISAASTAYYNYEFFFQEAVTEQPWSIAREYDRYETIYVPDSEGSLYRVMTTDIYLDRYSYIDFMNAWGHPTTFSDLDSLTTYRVDEKRYHVTEYQQKRIESWDVQKIWSKNTRLPDWINELTFEPKIIVDDIKYLYWFGSVTADSFEFSYITKSYLGINGPIMGYSANVSYAGDDEGNYIFNDDIDKPYGSMIVFSDEADPVVRISSGFGYRDLVIDGVDHSGQHNGIDIPLPEGTALKAVAGGTVFFADYQSGYGYVIKIIHDDGFMSVYGHCNALFKAKDERVEMGEIIAASGNTGRSTGPHLHFEIRDENGIPVDPMDYIRLEDY